MRKIYKRGGIGKLCFSKRNRGLERLYGIMKEVNDWDHNVDVDAVRDSLVSVGRDNVIQV